MKQFFQISCMILGQMYLFFFKNWDNLSIYLLLLFSVSGLFLKKKEKDTFKNVTPKSQ